MTKPMDNSQKAYAWPVVPLCDAQLQDVNPNDILANGLYRKCNTYKGGGGYDQFPAIYEKRFGKELGLNDQFVVQLSGCPLRCPYCYVTQEGVFGKPTHVTTNDLVRAFHDSGCKVFHLMGGAPAIYLDKWPELLSAINGEIFHSDFVLLERTYSKNVLKDIARFRPSLYAISIKGANEEEYMLNTNTKIDMHLLWRNLDALIDSGINFYFTFTGMSDDSISIFKKSVLARYKGASYLLNDSFPITLRHYKALDYNMSK